MPLKVESPESTRRTLPLNRIFSIAALVIAVGALVLALRKPQPVVTAQPRQAMAANAQSFQAKVDQLATPSSDGQGIEVRLTAPEISAAIAQSAGSVPQTNTQPTSDSAKVEDVTAAINAAEGEPNVGEPVVTFDGDLMKGQFVTELGGKKVYVTVTGHLGSKDGYATFDPTEFKVGDLNVPVSLVNDALQKKMLEQRDRLKLPDYVSGVKVENGELVVTKK
jgi:hypothetical protein